jgi:GNAT superfamily N-acetyltransferase
MVPSDDEPVFDFLTEDVTAPLGEEWEEMTFPSYQHLLRLVGTGNADAMGVRPVASVAKSGFRPIGLAIAELPTSARPTAELLSIFVAEDVRGRGVGTALLAQMETDLARRGVTQVTGVYMTGKPSIAGLERVFAKRGFTPPALRRIVLRFTPEEATHTEWYRKGKLPDDCSVVPWAEVSREEKEAVKRSHAEHPWIDPDLEPWRADERFDEVSSVGLRQNGQIVGWVINHRAAPNMVTFTTSFVRHDLARRGVTFPLFAASLERLQGTGVTCTFVTAAVYAHMNRFVLRRCAPFATFCGETRGVSKQLSSHVGGEATA